MKYILLNRISVQGANAIAGFTANYIGITHVLGYIHNLQRKLNEQTSFDVTLGGCALISHKHHIHRFKNDNGTIKFTQSRNPRYMHGDNSPTPAPVIEEGKMDLTLSLVVSYQGNVTQEEDAFRDWIKNQCIMQRLAGGSVRDIAEISLYSITDDSSVLRQLKRKLMPGFMLHERVDLLAEHMQSLQAIDKQASSIRAWMDFIALRQSARPKHDLLDKHFEKLANTDIESDTELAQLWHKVAERPYQVGDMPQSIVEHFANLKSTKANKSLLTQWKNYFEPNAKSDADWSYLPKPATGYLVPIMTGYKAISDVMPNNTVAHVRDSKTDVCFVEAVHTIGEWHSVHRIKTADDLQVGLWQYSHEAHWYLCTQSKAIENTAESNQQPTNNYF